MTDIKVILESENIGIESLNKEERELIFDRILSENPALNRAIIDSHAELLTNVIAHENRIDKPSIVELLLRKVIINSQDPYSSPAHNRIIPLIAYDTAGIKVQFDVHILGARPGGEYVVPPGEEINIVGIVLNDFCHQVLTMTNKGLFPTDNPFYSTYCNINLIDEIALRCDIHDRAVMFDNIGNSLTLILLGAIFDCLIADIPEFYFNELESISTREIPTILSPQIPEVTTEPLPNPALLETLGGTFVNSGVLTLLMDIYGRNFGNIYERAQIAGEKDPQLLEAIARIRARVIRNEFAYNMRLRAAAARDLENEYRRVIAKKFGEKRAQVSRPFESLTDSERKAVLYEVKKNEEYLFALLNNKCPHVAILRKLRRAKDIVTIRRELAALKRYFSRTSGRISQHKSTMQMITCNNCKFDLICPHVVEKLECELKDCSYNEMKNRLSEFISVGGAKDQQCCNICGEIIAVTFGDDSAQAPIMDEELKNFIWGEVAGLIKYLKFGALIDVMKLITHCRDQIYQYIFDIEKQILKSKTNSADEIKSKKRLYITMYAMGYFINLIISGSNVTEITFKGFTQKSKNLIADLIRHSIELITTARNIAIRSTGITQDVIKNTMVEIFKTIHNAGQQIIMHTGASESLSSLLALDPVYQYFRRQYDIDLISRGKKIHPGASIAGTATLGQVESVLGATLTALEKSGEDVYKHSIIPHYIKGKLPTLAEKYAARSFLSFRDKVISRSYINPVYVLQPISDERTEPESFISPELIAESEKFATLLKLELEYLTDIQSRCSHLYTWFTPISDRSWKDRHGSLGRIYDENGVEHDFEIFISDGKEFSASSIAKEIEAGIKFTGTITDKKCTICGILWSEISGLHEDKIRTSLAEKSGINGFFQFYDQRCPIGGMHEWVGGSHQCKKCGFTGKIDREYYQKYHSTYIQDRREGVGIQQRAHPVVEPPVVEFSFNFNIVLDLANKLKISQHLIMAIGATEQIEYTDIQSGIYIPRETDERFDTRIYVIDGHIKNFITEYNQLKHFHKLIKPPAELSAIIENSGFSRHKIIDLATLMPDISSDYRLKFAYIQMYRKPRDILSFVRQSLCEIVLAVWNDITEETKKLRHDFCSYAIKKILRGEELLSKPGYFNWSLLYGDRESTTTDSNTQERTGTVMSDDETDEIKSHFDVENDSDEEVPDVHIGDEYGL